jgi:hypothetical protein
MANRRKKRRGAKGPAPTAQAASPAPVTTPTPAFWFGFEVAWAKLAIARVVLFGLLALDAFFSVEHAARYGSGFNVPQLPGLDAIAPGRAVYEIGELGLAYLFALVACGVATRIALPIATAIYAWFYFSSQLDSYQHHYLVALILLLACFVPWQRPRDAQPSTPVRSWALRLVLVQLAIMYGWAAIGKLDPAWLNGHTLAAELHGKVGALIDGSVGMAVAATSVIAVELALATTVWWRRAWPLAAPLGIAFHLGIVFSGLEIGLFAWLMLGLYILVVPDRIWIWLAERARPLTRRLGYRRWTVAIALVAVGFVAAGLCRLDHTIVVALVGLAIAAAGSPRTQLRAVAAAHAIVLVAWVVLDRGTSVATDYYKRWGVTARRVHDVDGAEYAYQRLTEIAPDDVAGHYYLGRLLVARGVELDGLVELREAQRLDPGQARAFIDEACVTARRGDAAAALTSARAAATAEPANPAAKALVTSLSRPGAPVPKLCERRFDQP